MRLPAALTIVLLLLLAACAASAPTEATSPAPAAPPATATSGSQPAPASTDRRTLPEPAGAIDATCKTDADCTVKNVGSCCGYYPACVNVNSPTDPKGVQAECAKKGMMSVCGFKDINTCTCSRGHCEAASGGALVQ
jgi:hypothetical protein